MTATVVAVKWVKMARRWIFSRPKLGQRMERMMPSEKTKMGSRVFATTEATATLGARNRAA